MRINKWIPIVLAINIGVLCFALYVATTYQQQNYIVSCEQPITNYSILEVNCRGHRMHSTVKIAYAGKDYYVGVSRELCKNIGQAEFFYDMQHDTVFEKDYLCMRHIVFFFVLFLNSATVSINRLSDSKLSLWCLGALFDCCISRDKPFHPLTPPSDLRQYAVENRQEIRISQSLY